MQAIFIQRFNTFSVVMTPPPSRSIQGERFSDDQEAFHRVRFRIYFSSLLTLKPKRLQVKCTVSVHVAKAYGGVEVELHEFLIPARDGGELKLPRPGSFIRRARAARTF